MPIKILGADLISKIAAGEVIERPASGSKGAGREFLGAEVFIQFARDQGLGFWRG